MIKITDKTKCCGCGACTQICPNSAITMQSDSEGFLYPIVDEQKCIKCGLCLKTCPILNNKKQEILPRVYAAKNKDTEVLKQSSSGGMFSILADYVLEQNGVIFGAAFNKDWEVYHRFIDKKEDLDILRRSKYVQSNTLETFKETKKFLEQGRQVLYTGTPCQIAGLKNFLHKDYDNLITCDLICHGTPSPGVWSKFLNENFDLKTIKQINFRDKEFAWNSFYLSITTILGKTINNKKIGEFYRKLWSHLYNNKIARIFFSNSFYNSFFSAFCAELLLRPSCHKCYIKQSITADFTIGDAWGYIDYAPEMFDKNGLSVVFINNKKAEKIFERINENLIYREVPFNKVIKYNPYYNTSVKANPKREEFFQRFQKEQVSKLIEELTYRPLWQHIFGRVKKIANKILKFN